MSRMRSYVRLQVLKGRFFNCVMVITPSRAYVNRTITWLFQWCRRPIGLFKGCGVSQWSYSNETQSCRFGRRGVAGWSSCHECSCRRTWRIRRWPLGRPHEYAIWRAIDWKRDWDITNLQSIEPVHCDAVTRSRRLAGKSWITVSLTCDAAAGGSICHLHPRAGCGGPAHPKIDVGERQTRLREKYVGPRVSCPMPAIKSVAISRLMKRLYGLSISVTGMIQSTK